MIDNDIAEAPTVRRMLSKVPEVTVWFWVIKILCTTVGESFADWIDQALGVGLVMTAVIFTIVTAVVLAVQLRLRRYVPAAYWLVVVVLSITGTLYTDLLTDLLGVPLWVSTAVFAAMLATVFGLWWRRERTLSIHSITTTPREAFYWLAVLVTFALGTAVGDWTLELTGWGPGTAILLPLGLIAVVALLWRLGANAVLAFWIAYILTRPLGANIGDWLALPTDQQGLGLGAMLTSVVFLAAILAVVAYLSVSRADVVERHRPAPARPSTPATERRALVALAVVAVATVALLTVANRMPHASALADEGPVAASSCASGAPLDDASGPPAVAAAFPASDVANFRAITDDLRSLVDHGDRSGAAARATDLESAWDTDADALNAADCRAWTFVDERIDPVLAAVRATNPDAASEHAALDELAAALGSA